MEVEVDRGAPLISPNIARADEKVFECEIFGVFVDEVGADDVGDSVVMTDGRRVQPASGQEKLATSNIRLFQLGRRLCEAQLRGIVDGVT